MKSLTAFLALALALPAAAAAESTPSPAERTIPRSPARAERKSPDAVADPLTRFAEALLARQFDEASRDAEAALRDSGGGAALLDELTYRLVDVGARAQAGRLLLQAYPFAAGGPSQRALLLRRLAMLVEAGQVRDQDAAPLREPLDTPALRSVQGALWAEMKDCGAVRRVLGDMASSYGYDDWMRLGDCAAADAPAVSLDAYARAHALQPGSTASRALAYGAFAAGDSSTALRAWRSVPDEKMSVDDLMGAVTTALEAGDAAQAGSWLEQYHRKGGAADHRYWSLVAQSAERRGDASGAIAALQQAVAIHPESDDYMRLAKLATDDDRKVTWLGQAAALAPADAAAQMNLAYALVKAGRTTDAIAAFERAATLDPSNVNVQLELGYAYSRAGNLLAASRAFERAWNADRGNVAAAQELVYINQRLSRNTEARKYAEDVLDATAGAKTTTDVQADRQFGFQRLHEDLGRRVTASFDGWSGTHVGTGTSASRAGAGFRSYSQAEADVRLGSPAIRNGKTVSAYFRLIGDSGTERQALPVHNRTVGMGLRWKPFGSRVFYVAAEQQAAVDGPRSYDTLVRTSASLFNGGRFGDDWHASGRGWFAQNLYLDAAHYIRAEYSAVTGDYRGSYHKKIARRQSVEPYAHFQITGVRLSGNDSDVRIGAGSRWNLWIGGTKYDADPHKFTVGVEYQQTLDTYLPDSNGVFLSLGARW